MYPPRGYMQSLLNRWYVRDALIIIVACIATLLYLQRVDSGFPLDDSWIHQVYGRNLAEFGEWAFIEGEPSAASTAPLYTALLAVGYTFDLPYEAWTHLLGAFTLILAGLISARLTERISPEKTWTPLASGLAIVSAWHLIWSAVSGMETMLFSMFTILLMWLAWRELDKRSDKQSHIMLRGFIFGIVSALAMLTRPEGVMLAGIVGLLMLIVRPQGNFRKTLMWGGASLIGFLLLISPYLLLNLDLTGGLLPATSDAKYAQHLVIIQQTTFFERLLIMTIPVLAGGQFLLVFGLIRFVVPHIKRIRINPQSLFYLLPVIWIIAMICLYAVRLPAGYQHGRYVIPVIPAMIIVGVVGTTQFIMATNEDERDFAIGRLLSRVVAVSALGSFIYFGFILGPDVYEQDVDIINEEMVDVAHWIEENIPEGELLAIHDIGAVGYFAPRPILDIAGLINPEVVPIIDNEEALWMLMQDYDARYLMAFPDQVPGDDINDSRICILYQSNGRTSFNLGGGKMTVYRLTWNGECPS